MAHSSPNVRSSQPCQVGMNPLFLSLASKMLKVTSAVITWQRGVQIAGGTVLRSGLGTLKLAATRMYSCPNRIIHGIHTSTSKTHSQIHSLKLGQGVELVKRPKSTCVVHGSAQRNIVFGEEVSWCIRLCCAKFAASNRHGRRPLLFEFPPASR